LAAGDLSLAAKILWLTLKMEWKKGVHALNQVWVKVKEFFLSTWTEAVFGAAKIATNAWAGLQAGWTQTVDFLRDTWSTFTTFLAKNWNKVVGFIKGAWQ
jgi:1,2-phenylacetyl-CoA epoxidase catalytic subunit